MGRAREPAAGSVPEKGDVIAWTLFEHEQRGGPKLPDPEDTPWTHGGPPEAAAAPVLQDARKPEDARERAWPDPDPMTEEDFL
jgi:hypothetical protein